MTKIEQYFLDRVGELKTLATRGDPWVFACATSFIEYLAKMHLGKTTTASDYKAFLRDVFFKACPAYASFTFASGSSDLDIQMYHTLRCGLVHSFSLIADQKARSAKGRDRSILLAHRKNGAVHLRAKIDNRRRPKIDAVVFTAEDFVDDIETATKYLFQQARKPTPDGRLLKANIKSWTKAHPPIGTLMRV